VISRLQEVYAIATYLIDKPMFLRDATRPAPRECKTKWFRLADALKGISQYSFDELERSQRSLAVGLYPIAQVLTKFRMKYCFALQRAELNPSSRRSLSKDSGFRLRLVARCKAFNKR